MLFNLARVYSTDTEMVPDHEYRIKVKVLENDSRWHGWEFTLEVDKAGATQLGWAKRIKKVELEEPVMTANPSSSAG
jgi:hypothetical protein